MKDYSQPARTEDITIAIAALKAHGITAEQTDSSEAAKNIVLERIPEGSEVFTMSSATLDTAGISEALNTDKYTSVRNQLGAMYKEKDADAMRKLGSAPDYAVGSVHAITQDGKLVVVSNTGSQLPAYAYGAGKVIFVVGAQKVVKDLAEAMQRIETYTLPLESKRVQKAYGMPNSVIRKWLIIDSELVANRIHVVIINENIGF